MLNKFQLTEDLALTEALQYAHNPTAVSPIYLFGETSLPQPPGPSTSLGKRGGGHNPTRKVEKLQWHQKMTPKTEI